MSAARVLVALLLLPASALADSLQVLVLEVEPRLVGPTYDRATGGDPAALEEAIGKMRLLAPTKGVRILLELDIRRDDPEKVVQAREMDYVADPKGTSRRYEIGHDFRWSRLNGVPGRTLKLHLLRDAGSLHRHSFSFHHHLTDRWGLSAGTATPQGAVFVFEKLTTPDPAAVAPRWILSTLHEPARRKPNPEEPRKRLTAPPLGRTAILRLPDNRSLASTAESDFAVHNGYARGFSTSMVRFGANNTSTSHILKKDIPPRANLEMKLIVEQGVASQVTHSGTAHVLLEDSPALTPFPATHRDETREGSTTRSTGADEKPEYFLEGHLIPAPNGP